MGLIKAGVGSAAGTLSDQWKEMIYCESLDQDTLVAKGAKRTNERTSNTKGDENIISNGSAVVVNDGQCMLIVEQGKVVDVCAEPGEFIYDSATSPSVFTGNLGTGIIDTFKNIGKRFSFGADTGVDQRVYYINTKEIVGNKYGTVNPVPFRVVDANIGLDIDIALRCNGEYSYRIVDPVLFYTNVCGNVEASYKRDQIASQLRTELLTALQPAFARISQAGVRYSAVPAHTTELAAALNELLSAQWSKLRGIEIVAFGVNTIVADEEDENLIKDLQRAAVMRDPTMAAANIAAAQGDAMRAAAANEGGAMNAFIGMGMAAGAGGANAQQLFAMGQAAPQQTQTAPMQTAMNGAYAAGGAAYGSGATGTANAAAAMTAQTAPAAQTTPSAQPAQGSVDTWICPACGSNNAGKFCPECGTKRPEPAAYRCSSCGYTPPDPTKPPKFCPECGNRFDEADLA